MIIENNSQIGGNQNGKQQLNSHLKELFLIIMFLTQEIKMVEFNLVNFNNGQLPYNKLILIQQEVMLWVILQYLPNKH